MINVCGRLTHSHSRTTVEQLSSHLSSRLSFSTQVNLERHVECDLLEFVTVENTTIKLKIQPCLRKLQYIKQHTLRLVPLGLHLGCVILHRKHSCICQGLGLVGLLLFCILIQFSLWWGLRFIQCIQMTMKTVLHIQTNFPGMTKTTDLFCNLLLNKVLKKFFISQKG